MDEDGSEDANCSSLIYNVRSGAYLRCITQGVRHALFAALEAQYLRSFMGIHLRLIRPCGTGFGMICAEKSGDGANCACTVHRRGHTVDRKGERFHKYRKGAV